MSLITQCPACATLFKVVPDQLRVSDGWVRCGQCDEVFDANAHLQTTQQEARQSTFGDSQFPSEPVRSRFGPGMSSGDGSTAAHRMPSAPQDGASRLGASAASSAGASSGASVGVAERALAPPPETGAQTEAAVRAEYEALLRSVELESDSAPRAQQEQEQEQEQEPGESSGVDDKPTPRDEWADAIGEPVLSFMQVRQTADAPSRPWVRPTLWVCCLALSLALVLQVILRERDWMSAKAPALTPLLTALCDAVGCQVSALREIESVVIDSSSFVKVRTDVYRVHLTLKNTAIYAVATPALELTLTNVHDQPIGRRIIFPREFGAIQGAMAPGAELLATVAIRAKLPSDTESISGYRVLVFYP